MQKLTDILRRNKYPGRGIVVGKNLVYYFIMGRSENSQNRIFIKTEDGIRTGVFDESRMTDTSLIIYHPVRRTPMGLIVTNGDQTDTIAQMGDFRAALMTREFEPDEPNWTPRISAILYDNGSFEMSIIKKKNGGCSRQFFNYDSCPEGMGYFISTYQGDGNPLPSFEGEPVEVDLRDEPLAVWYALYQANKISMYTYINGEECIFNKNLLSDLRRR